MTLIIGLAAAGLALVLDMAPLGWAAFGLILVMLLGIAWLRRSLPTYRGQLRLPGLLDRVEVYRDSRGVPHLCARNLHDLYLAQGYVTADDRLWSMDTDRMAASGRLAELMGADWVHVDRHFRTIGLRRAAEASLAAYSEEGRECLEAYAAGINARIGQGRLPPEFGLMGRRPEPWTAVDSLTLIKYVAYGLGGNWDEELFRANLIQAVGAAKAAELFGKRPALQDLAHLEEIALPDTTALMGLAALTLNGASGSNAWAVSGSRSQTTGPLLANDPHLAVRTPSPWYQSHLFGPAGMDVMGVTFPGIPGILLGRNQHIAWGATNLNADVQDLYVEQLHPDDPNLVRWGDGYEPMTQVEEVIRVRGRRQPVLHEVSFTRHGPVIAQAGATALSLRWAALEPSAEIENFLRINRAESWPAFREALRGYGAPAQNFICADRSGNIAWRAQGRIPIRARGDGQAPVPGWSGEYEWDGYIPFGQLPEVVNPPEGFVVSANEEPRMEGYAHFLGASWASPYRAQRITERLRGATRMTAQRMQEIQTDVVNLHTRSLLPVLLGAVQEGLRQAPHHESLNEAEKRVLLMLSGWDGKETAERPEPAMWQQWYLFLVEELFRPQMGLTLYDQFVASGLPVQMTDRLVKQVAEGKPSRWLSPEGEEGLGRLALRAFRRSVALVAAKQGRSPEFWRWGREHRLTIRHPISRGGNPLGSLMDQGSFSAPGSGHTINCMAYSKVRPFSVTTAPLWRFVADLFLPEESSDILASGQSGHFLSPHYGDQIGPWLRGELLPQVADHDRIRRLSCLVLLPRDSASPRN